MDLCLERREDGIELRTLGKIKYQIDRIYVLEKESLVLRCKESPKHIEPKINILDSS
jgi:hypothetical protein